jgi:hypothetical protein
MRKCSFCFFVLLLLVPLTIAKDKPQLPKLVVSAKYVLVTTYEGDRLSNPRMMPDDRQAVTDVQDAIRKWGRYIVVYQRKDADLIILVRKGRFATALGGVRIHAGSEAPSPSIGTTGNADVGDPQDMIALYVAAEGIDSPALWRGRQVDGLKPPEMNLIQELRTKVEAAANAP